ncbi:terminase small subunit [Bacillus paranthracis]|uniref:terminase small subunit n=1 Tax=Bacillus cereus group TaxID=86661 RepID=UPI001F58E009|nr:MULTISPECIES: terminase small subunit [Bacillus cereus group]MCU5020532.1 terminase small subunit [Bacillus paranthracis]
MSKPAVRWKAIRYEWETTEISFRDLAEKFGLSINTVKSRRTRENWSKDNPAPYDPIAEDNEILLQEQKARQELIDARDKAVKQMQQLQKMSPAKLKRDGDTPVSIEYTREDGTTVESDLLEYLYDEHDGLTEQERLFCYYYLINFNATRSYMKAYNCSYVTAKTQGYLLPKRPLVAEKLRILKQNNATALNLEAQDIVTEYMKIAFADITDYVEFGKQVKTVKYPPKDEGEEGMTEEYYVNYVDLKDSSQVDGSLITEIKQGRDGVSIKLADKMKALDFLAKYTDVLKLKEKHELEKLKLQADIDKVKADTGEGSGDGSAQVVILSGEEEMRRVLAQQQAQEEPTEEVANE